MNLVALFEEALEFQNFNGTVLSNGKVKVFYIGRTSLADIYNDVAGEYPSENPKILNNLGMGPIYVNPAFDYEIVVYDEYDNELFSVKKYLHSSGAHSTSNVEVVPSENIQVSAWTQGDVQVYMPYITGNLGKVYTGIEPIVVNNSEDKISANHVPLGLQEPLYFVEDSESACIIGCSSQSEFPESATEAINAVTANSAIWNGPYVPLGTGNFAEIYSLAQGRGNSASFWSMAQGEENTANDRSLAQGSYNSAIGNSMAQGVYNYAEEESMVQGEHNSAYKNSIAQGKFNSALNNSQVFGDHLIATATGMAIGQYNLTQSAAFVIGNGTSGARSDAFVIDHSGNVSSQGDISASGVSLTSFYTDYQTNSANFVTALPDDLVYTGDLNDYAKKDFVLSSIDSSTSGLLPTSSFSSVSGSFLTALPSDLVYTADITGFATTGDLANKLDTTAFSTVSGDFLTAHQDLSDYQTIAGMTAYQPAGDYLTTADSAQFITALPADLVYTADIQDMATTGDLADKLDTSAFSSVSGDYLVGSNVSGFVITATGDGFSNGMTVAISQDAPFAGMYFSESDINGSKQIYIDPEKIMFYSAGEFSTSEAIDAGDIATLKTLSSSKQDNLTFSYTTANEISAINSSAIAGGTGGSFPSSANEACEVVTTNSAEWNKASGLSGYVRNDTRWLDIGVDNYVETINAASQTVYDSFAFGYKNSAASTAVSMGNANSAGNQSLTQGNKNSAFKNSFAQGTQNYASGTIAGSNSNGSFTQGFKNSAYFGSFAQGSYNVASGYSFAQGGSGSNSNSAIKHSFAQGSRCVASAGSFAQGNQCYAEDYSIAQGNGAVASSYSQAFGLATKAYSSGMAIGTYNETDSAAFVIGNGDIYTRSDAFIVYHDGSVSAAGKISANGVELGAGSEIPAGTMNESAFGYDASNNITAYNGSAFKAGDEFPQSATEAIEVVTANSGDWNSTTDTVSSNSGVWGGSALPISAGPGVKMELVDNTLVFSNDETVLWSGTKNTTAGAETLSESYMNFDKIDIYLTFDTSNTPQRAQSITRYYVGNHTTAQPLYVYATANNIAANTLTAETLYISGSPNGTGFSLLAGIRQVNSTVTTGITTYNCNLKQIVGINRKSGV